MPRLKFRSQEAFVLFYRRRRNLFNRSRWRSLLLFSAVGLSYKMKKGWRKRVDQWTLSFLDPTWSLGGFLGSSGSKVSALHLHTHQVVCLQPGPAQPWQPALFSRSEDPETLPCTETQWISAYVSCSAEQNPLKKEVELLGRGLVPFVNCICVQGAGLFTTFPEKCFKSRIKSREGIKAVQELITTINFAETSWCFADSLVFFW